MRKVPFALRVFLRNVQLDLSTRVWIFFVAQVRVVQVYALTEPVSLLINENRTVVADALPTLLVFLYSIFCKIPVTNLIVLNNT